MEWIDINEKLPKAGQYITAEIIYGIRSHHETVRGKVSPRDRTIIFSDFYSGTLDSKIIRWKPQEESNE